MRKTTTLFPFIPGRAEWDTLPWDAARAAARAQLGTDKDLTFVGANDSAFHFQVYGVGQVSVARIAEEVRSFCTCGAEREPGQPCCS